MTDIKPYLGRCKDCDYAIFLADPATAIYVDGFRQVTAGSCAYRVGNNGYFSRCPSGHKFFPLRQIKGTYSKDHKCDARCLNAKGHNCTCSCGGANHGRGYAIEVREAAAPQPVREVEPATAKQANYIRSLLGQREIPTIRVASAEGPVEVSAAQRIMTALDKLDNGDFTKKQASATIKWLLELPEVES